MVICVAYGCTNTSEGQKSRSPRLGLFRFPQEPIMRDLWIRAVGRDDWTPNEDSRLCSEHFSADQINSTYPSRMALRDGAVPNIFSRSRPSTKSESSSEGSSSPSPKPKRRKRKPPAKRSSPAKPNTHKILKEEDPFHIKDYMVVEVTQLDNPEENKDSSQPTTQPNLSTYEENPHFIEYSKKDTRNTRKKLLEEDSCSESPQSECEQPNKNVCPGSPRSECDHPDEDQCPLYPTTSEGCAKCYYMKNQVLRFKTQSKRFKRENERLKKENKRLNKASSSETPTEECLNCDTLKKENESLKIRLKMNELLSGTPSERTEK